MTERWTDKKRGFSGDRGNLGSHINPMSFNRKTRELLGDLFQTKDQRVTPDGNVMVKAFGKYEKFKFEPVKTKEAQPVYIEYLLVNQNGYDEDQDINIRRVQVIEIKENSYKVLYDIDLWPLYETFEHLRYSPFDMYWHNGKIIIPDIYGASQLGHKFWEYTPRKGTGVVSAQISDLALKAIYVEGPTPSTKYASEPFFSSMLSGNTIRSSRSIFWESTEYVQYTYTTYLSKLSTNGYDVTMYDATGRSIVSQAIEYNEDGSPIPVTVNFETTGEPYVVAERFIYITPDDVRILHAESNVPYIYQACNTEDKIAYLIRGGSGYHPNPYELRLCNTPWVAAASESTPKKTPVSYVEDYTVLKTSNILTPASGNYCYGTGIIVGTEFLSSNGNIEQIIVTDPYYGWSAEGDMRVEIRYVNWHPSLWSSIRKTSLEPDNLYTPEETNANAMIFNLNPPVPAGSSFTLTDPLGVEHEIKVPLYSDVYGTPQQPVYTGFMVWGLYYSSYTTVESYSDIAFVNNSGNGKGLFVVVGQKLSVDNNGDMQTIFRIVVLDERGVELYELPLVGDDPSEISYIRVNKAIIKIN